MAGLPTACRYCRCHHRVAGAEPDEDGNPVGRVFVAVAARDGRKGGVRHDYGDISKARNLQRSDGRCADLVEQVLREQVR